MAPGILYSVAAVVVLVVAVGGMLGVVFGTPSGTESPDRGSQVLAVVAALFLLAMLVQFLFGGLGIPT
jgi:hypothetical protein